MCVKESKGKNYLDLKWYFFAEDGSQLNDFV